MPFGEYAPSMTLEKPAFSITIRRFSTLAIASLRVWVDKTKRKSFSGVCWIVRCSSSSPIAP